MATGAIIGALRVVLGADTAALETGLNSAASKLDKFGLSSKLTLAAIGTAIAGAAAAVSLGIKGAVDNADALGKAAQKLGIPVEELSKLQFAAERAGVSSSDFSKIIRELDVNIGKAAAGGTGDFSNALAAMGVSLRNTNTDTKAAVAGANDLSKALTSTSASLQTTSADTKAAAGGTNDLSAALAATGANLRDTNKDANTAAGGATTLSNAITATGTSLQSIDSATKSAAGGTRDLSSAATDASASIKIAGKSTGDFSNALATMGVSLKDSNGKVKTQTQLLGDIADKFQGYEDGANKTALATALFNKHGSEFIVLLNQGRKGLDDAAAAAEKTGNVISTKTSVAAIQFNDTIKILTENNKGFYNQLADKLLPVMNQLASSFITLQNQSKNADTNLKLIDGTMRVIAAATTVAVQGFQNFATIWLAVVNSIYQATRGNFSGAAQIITDAVKTIATDTTDAFKKAYDALKGIQPVIYDDGKAFDDLAHQVAKVTAPTIQNTKALTDYLDQVKQSVAIQDAQTASLNLNAGAQAAAKVEAEAKSIADKNHITIQGTLRSELDKTKASIQSSTDALEGQKLILENTDPWTRYQDELQKTNDLLLAKNASLDQLQRNSQRVAAKFQSDQASMGQSIADTAGQLSQFTATVGKENKVLGALSKALALGQAAMNTAVAITKAGTTFTPLTPPWYAAVALAVATGATAAATILSQGFAMGGSFRVPGGISPIDNRTIPLTLAAGEQVDVTPAQSTSSGTSITVDMRGDQGFFSRGNVERMLNAMHTVMADGHNVQLVVLK